MAATAEVPKHYLNVYVYNIRTTSLVGLATGGHGPADAAYLLPERPPDVAVWVCRSPHTCHARFESKRKFAKPD